MEPKTKTSAKDFFLNLGAFVTLYTTVITLINLLFTVINRAYPQISNGYSYVGSQSISWPVAMLIIFFPLFVVLMWLLERGYKTEPEKRHIAVKKWLTYITLFFAGLALAIDLVTILYYFIDGQELTMGFVMKILSVFVVTLGVFMYFISEIREKLDSSSRKIWLSVSVIVILICIVWGFVVLGSPRTQRLYKYDEEKVNNLMSINNDISNYYSMNGILPNSLQDLKVNYYLPLNDSQTQKPYEYKKTGNLDYEICADFNKESVGNNPNYKYAVGANGTWVHPAGRYCFPQKIDTQQNLKVPQAQPVVVR